MNVTFGIIVAGRIREGCRGVAEVYPNRPDRRIYSAFLSKDNLLFILSARSKQELENISTAKIRDKPLDYLHVITAAFGCLYNLILLLCQIYILLPDSQ